MALSDEQIRELAEDGLFFSSIYEITRAIEAEVRKDFADTLEAQDAEIARLNKAIHYEQSYLTHIGTHGPDCWKWGPQHYQCALAEIARIHSAAEIGKAPPCA